MKTETGRALCYVRVQRSMTGCDLLLSSMMVGDLRAVVNKDRTSNALAQDATIEGSGYWQAMHWHKR
jgi:hypothetical protein